MNSNVIGLLNILEEIKKKKLKLKLFNAGSGQFYGNNKKNTYGLYSKIDPQSPYGVQKLPHIGLQKYIENIIKFIVVQAYYLTMSLL